MSEFGGLIREARERMGLSTHRVGELIGRAPGAIRAWERGRTVPGDPFVVTSLAAVLAIDEQTLFRAAGLTPPGVAPVTTIEQELASIAPRPSQPESEPVSGPQTSETVIQPEMRTEPRRSSVATDEHPVTTGESDGEVASAAEVLGDLLERGIEKSREALARLSAPSPRAPDEPQPTRDPRPASAPTRTLRPARPTGTYLEDDDERWAYRLRTIWTAAGVTVLVVLLMWSGSRLLEAFGDAWDALLAGL